MTQDEGDSPRGRIALMQALADNRLPAQGRLEFHLERCLACRACERACPSGVRYGPLIDSARALIEQTRQRPAERQRTRSMLLALLGARPQRLRRAVGLLRLYQISGLRWLARHSGLLRGLGLDRLDKLLPVLPPARRRREYYPPPGRARGQVALFAGCLTDAFAPETLDAAIRLLTRAGYGVHVPSGQRCCGALHLHSGAPAEAAVLAQKNVEAFNRLEIEAVLYTASACGTMLREYPAWTGGSHGMAGAEFAAPVMDVTAFLAGLEWPADVSFSPLDKRIAVQDPCLQRNVVRDISPPYRLLEKIPALTVEALPGNEQCCGAAGTYMLTQAELSDALRADKLEALRRSGASVLVTSNLGCAIHLAEGVCAAAMDVEVMHPVSLLERQLKVNSER